MRAFVYSLCGQWMHLSTLHVYLGTIAFPSLQVSIKEQILSFHLSSSTLTIVSQSSLLALTLKKTRLCSGQIFK